MQARHDDFTTTSRPQVIRQRSQDRAAPMDEQSSPSMRRLQWLIGIALAVLMLNAALVVTTGA